VKFTIVTASDQQLNDFIIPCIKSIEKCGYNPIFYNLGGLDFGIPFRAETSQQAHKKFPKKPFVIKDAMKYLKKYDWLAWIDIDCIMQMPIDDAISSEYDVGLTFRKNHINSGVTFWQKNNRAISFLEKWCNESIAKRGDQNALNNLLNITTLNNLDFTTYRYGLKFKLLDSRIYNNFFFKKDQSKARIIHYKSKHRSRFPFYKGKN
jgi:hypothetical protein